MQMDYKDIKALAKALVREMDTTELDDNAPKWGDATIQFVPDDDSLKAHEMSFENFMKKIIAVRNNLRVLEQQVNASKNLSNGEKVKFQG